MELSKLLLFFGVFATFSFVGAQSKNRNRVNHWSRPPTTTRRPHRPEEPGHDILKLGRYQVDRQRITISGFSSGGTLAQQLMFSHADLFSGLAVFSHAYYRCGPGDGVLDNYDRACTKLLPSPDKKYWDPEESLKDIRRYANQGLISDPRDLANKKLYVYAGLENIFFTLDTSLGILKIFEPFITNPANILTRVQDANLILPANTAGPRNCAENPFGKNNLFIANCGLNGPLEALQFIIGLGAVRPADASVRPNPLRKFDQRDFFNRGSNDFMDDVGYVYVPSGCEYNGGLGPNSRSPCLLHVYLHGCLTGRRFVGEEHIKRSGFLEIAERNRIIMLFPQNINATGSVIGCWDTYGASGELYATKKGNQVMVIKSMISRILGDGSINFQ